MTMKRHCLQIVGGLHPRYGGPSRAIPGLCDALNAQGYDITLITQKLVSDRINELLVPTSKNIRVICHDAVKRFGTIYSSAYGSQLDALVSQGLFNLIHSNGIWDQCNYHAAASAKRHRIPHLVCPHGMLEPWAFRHNAWKKRPLWRLWQRRALEEAAALIAESEQEVENIRMIGLRQPVAMIPYGMDFYGPGMPRTIRSGEDRIVLFLSRVHPKKGLRELVHAWSSVRPKGWKIVIAGPDQDGHQAEIEKDIRSLGLEHDIMFLGPIDGSKKEQLYRDASLFVLPSHSENFGIVVPEALSAGTPVITTKGTPWSELISNRCGWWVDSGVKPLADAIREAASLSDPERAAMGRRGRDFVLRSFGWDGIGRKMALFYDWIIDGGQPPDFVRFI